MHPHILPTEELRACGAGIEPKTPESRKCEETTKTIQNPPPQAAPRKYEKKKANNYKTGLFRPFLSFLFFRAQAGVGDFVVSFVIFSDFRAPGVLGLCTNSASSQLKRDCVAVSMSRPRPEAPSDEDAERENANPGCQLLPVSAV